MMNYILGGGISGLLWSYYHSDYTVITDQLGRAVTGADPVVWLNDTDLTRRLLLDLDMPVRPVEKKIGYRHHGYVGPHRASLTDNVLLKKMVPWETLEASQAAGIEVRVVTPSRRFTKDSEVLRYLDVSMSEVCLKLYEEVNGQGRIVYDRVKEVGVGQGSVYMVGEESDYSCDHLVSTVPAPIFARLWYGSWRMPKLHYCPVTFVVSMQAPSWWDDEYAVVYDASMDSPISRVGRFGETFGYEFTGRPDEDTLNEYMPVPQGRFVNPYGRIIQDVNLTPPPGVTFLGRSASWDYRGLIDVSLERVHGRR